MDQAQNSVPQSAPAPARHTYRLRRETRWTVGALLIGVVLIAIYAIWTLVSLLAGGPSGGDWINAAFMLAILVISPLVAWSLLAEWSTTITTSPEGLTWRAAGGLRLAYAWSEIAGLAPAAPRWRPFSLGDNARSAGRIAEPTSGTEDSSTATQVDTQVDTEGVPAPGEELTTPPAAPVPAAEPEDAAPLQLRVHPPAPERIANPLLRLLYRQAYADGVPIYAGLQDRRALLAEIAAHTTAA